MKVIVQVFLDVFIGLYFPLLFSIEEKAALSALIIVA